MRQLFETLLLTVLITCVHFLEDKVTIGKYKLQSVIENSALVGFFICATAGKLLAGSAASAFLVAFLVNTQFLLHLRSKDISQPIKGISNPLQKLLKCFNGTAVSIFSTSSHYFLIYL